MGLNNWQEEKNGFGLRVYKGIKASDLRKIFKVHLRQDSRKTKSVSEDIII